MKYAPQKVVTVLGKIAQPTPMLISLLLTAPWLFVGLFAAFWAKLPRGLPSPRALGSRSEYPLVSIIIPARNEERNIERCLRSIVASEYPNFEVIVVDDRSEDRTAKISRNVPCGNARGITVVDGKELPDGWFGKPWACEQGAAVADGEIFFFTDADTVHSPGLLGRAVAGLEEDRADALTLAGKQVLGSFWERLIQPQVFFLLVIRYPRLLKPLGPNNWRHAIANGQFIMVRAKAYRTFGGHESVRHEVVEDLRFAQLFCKSGFRLSVREARDDVSTRMYQSLRELVEGWGKNLYVGTVQAARPVPILRWIALPSMALAPIGLWVLPPLILVSSLFAEGAADTLLWAAVTTGFGVLFWGVMSLAYGVSPLYGFLCPVGAAVTSFIVARSWIRGSKVEWKGREYRVGKIN